MANLSLIDKVIPIRDGTVKISSTPDGKYQWMTIHRDSYGEEGVFFPPTSVTLSKEAIEALRVFLNDNALWLANTNSNHQK